MRRLLLPLALIVGAYHGLLLAVVTARPLWNTGPTVIAAMLSFVTTGIAAVMLVHLVRMKIAGRLVANDHLNEFLHDLKRVFWTFAMGRPKFVRSLTWSTVHRSTALAAAMATTSAIGTAEAVACDESLVKGPFDGSSPNDRAEVCM